MAKNKKHGVFGIGLVLLLGVASRAAIADDPCAGFIGVEDGVDEDGVLCDWNAQQAAQQRFQTLTAAADAAVIPAGKCDDPALVAIKAKLDGAAEWNKASRKQARAIASTDAMLSQLRADLAREKSNPSGVVSLSRLHQIGGDIQTETEIRAQQAAYKKAADDYVKSLTAATTAALNSAACAARKRAMAAAKADGGS